ncbi:MAG: NAD(+) diphosphatase [Sphingomonadales bacterium]
MLNNIPVLEPHNVFAGSPLDRCEHLRGDADKVAAMMRAPGARFVCLWKSKPMIAAGETLRIQWVNGGLALPLIEAGAVWVFLGTAENVPHFALDISSEPDPEQGGKFANLGIFPDLRMSAATLDRGDAAIIAQAKPLIDWHSRRTYCSVCGSLTEMRQSGASRVCTNDTCKASHFPRTDPVVIMLAIHGDRCLLGRQPIFPPKMYSALAGFMEPGESLEEAVRREIQEEAGVPVGDVRYHSSQPWPFPASLMIGCHAVALDDKVDLPGDELEEATWFDKGFIREVLAGPRRDQLRLPPPHAIAHQLIRSWASVD